MHFSRQSGTKTFSKTFLKTFFKTFLKALLRKTRKKTRTVTENLFFDFSAAFFFNWKQLKLQPPCFKFRTAKKLSLLFPDTILTWNVLAKNFGENFGNFFEHFFEDFFDNFFENPAPKTRKETETAAENFFCDFSAVFFLNFHCFQWKELKAAQITDSGRISDEFPLVRPSIPQPSVSPSGTTTIIKNFSRVPRGSGKGHFQ